MEDKEEGLLLSIGELLLGVELVLVEELEVKTDVSGLVDTVGGFVIVPVSRWLYSLPKPGGLHLAPDGMKVA